MPELPEMETYRRLLTPLIVGKTITGAEVERVKTIGMDDPGFFVQAVQGTSVAAIERRAKHLLFRLGNGYTLLLHLMLGGWMFYGTEQEKRDRTAQVTLAFGGHRLYFHGLRLGYLHLHTEETLQAKLKDLGPEPMHPSFGEADFIRALRAKRGPVKPALADQSVLAGIGNCYGDEMLFEAGILPSSRISKLGDDLLAVLYRAMRATLYEAIHYGGYMEEPLYIGDTLTGGYNERCRIYDRGGEPCFRCGTPIVQDELAGRKSFYCKGCQSEEGVRVCTSDATSARETVTSARHEPLRI